MFNPRDKVLSCESPDHCMSSMHKKGIPGNIPEGLPNEGGRDRVRKDRMVKA